jgi:hypothetical protein
LRQVRETDIELPDSLGEVEWLTPWAAALRYDEPEVLDRSAAIG